MVDVLVQVAMATLAAVFVFGVPIIFVGACALIGWLFTRNLDFDD